MQRKVLFVFLLVVLWLSGCSLLDNDNQPSASITETPATVAPTFTPTPITSSELVVPTPITETKTTLTIWLPPEIVVSTEAGTAILNAQIETFRASHDDLEIIVEQKAVTGQGSILSYLRTGRNIAPAILPDLIVIPTSQLESALNQELIFPLDELIDASLIEDLYPAAVELAHQSEQTAGYPFVLTNLPQLAYHATTITHTVPITWEAFINLPDNQFAFPAAGQAGASILLQMYLDAGGSLINDAGQFELQLEPLATALQQLSLGRQNGFILAESSNLATRQEAWQLLESGTATIIFTTGDHFLSERSADLSIEVAMIPGLERPLTPLVNGWAWAISASDPNRRILAAEFLMTLVDGQRLGEWSLQSNFIPARRSALTFWPEDDPYVAFLDEQLSLAQAHPLSNDTTTMTILGNAVFDVISLAKTPQVAAEEAIAGLQE